MTNGGRSPETEIAIYLGLGSNIGDREAHVREAGERIKALGLEITSASSLYETEPVGFTDQQWFLNQVIETQMLAGLTSECGLVFRDPARAATVQAETLLSELLKIEHAMGRARTIVNGPRVIDIDLLLFGDKIIAHSKDAADWPFMDVFVPHPRMHLRRFVLEPLCEIAPEIVHPLLKKTCLEMLRGLDDDSMVRIYKQRSPIAFISDQPE